MGDFNSDFNSDFNIGTSGGTLYRPPTKVSTMSVPWLSVVTRSDPDWARDRHREIQYEFTNRRWYVNPDVDGAYSPFTVLWQQGLPNS